MPYQEGLKNIEKVTHKKEKKNIRNVILALWKALQRPV
jgi:hypothetical protein